MPLGPSWGPHLFRNFFPSPAVATTTPLPGGPWQPVRYLGRGGFGSVVLFARLDANNVVQEFNPIYWPGSTDNDGHRDYSAGFSRDESMESLIHSKLAAVGSQAIVNYVGKSPVEHKHWRYRLYTKYCPHGTLRDLIKHYRDPDNFPDEETTTNGQGIELPDVAIPEPFIIRAVLSLAEAALIMRDGTAAADGPAIPNWKEILHRDIKTDNIFLQEPGQRPGDQWKLYPIPKLGDFGISQETADDDPNNPRAYQGIGSEGWYAREQALWINRADRSHFDPPKMDSKANVFAIGMVWYCLRFRVLHPTLDYLDGDMVRSPMQDDEDPGGPIFVESGYSYLVRDIMSSCLHFDPARRSTLEEIRDRLQPKGLDPDNLLYHGMRKIKPNNHPWHSDQQRGGKYRLQGNFVDDYRIGLNQAQLPAVVDPC